MNIKQKNSGVVFYILFMIWYFFSIEFHYSGDGTSAVNYFYCNFTEDLEGYSKDDLVFCNIILVMFFISLVIYFMGYKFKGLKYKRVNFVFGIVFLITFCMKYFVTSQRYGMSLYIFISHPINEYTLFSFPVIIAGIVVTVFNYKALKTEN